MLLCESTDLDDANLLQGNLAEFARLNCSYEGEDRLPPLNIFPLITSLS
jgi:hypothetical protein